MSSIGRGKGVRQVAPTPANNQTATDTPSGLLPSDLRRPVGSSREGMWADDKAPLMISFKAVCLWNLPSLRLQLRECLPSLLTTAEQCLHVCAPHTWVPRHRPTATLTVLSSEGATLTALQIPNPPKFTGRVACTAGSPSVVT